MIDRLFFQHPRSVNESYGEHLMVAGRFGGLLLGAGLVSLVHAVVPAFFTRTGSGIVKKLYGEMQSRQPVLKEQRPSYLDPQWRPEYEI